MQVGSRSALRKRGVAHRGDGGSGASAGRGATGVSALRSRRPVPLRALPPPPGHTPGVERGRRFGELGAHAVGARVGGFVLEPEHLQRAREAHREARLAHAEGLVGELLAGARGLRVRDMLAHADRAPLAPPFSLAVDVGAAGAAAALRLTPTG